MNKTTIQTISEQQELNRKLYNKENTTTEDIQQERIDVLNETIDIMNRIIKSDEEQINILKHAIEIDKIKKIKQQNNYFSNLTLCKANI